MASNISGGGGWGQNPERARKRRERDREWTAGGAGSVQEAPVRQEGAGLRGEGCWDGCLQGLGVRRHPQQVPHRLVRRSVHGRAVRPQPLPCGGGGGVGGEVSSGKGPSRSEPRA